MAAQDISGIARDVGELIISKMEDMNQIMNTMVATAYVKSQLTYDLTQLDTNKTPSDITISVYINPYKHFSIDYWLNGESLRIRYTSAPSVERFQKTIKYALDELTSLGEDILINANHIKRRLKVFDSKNKTWNDDEINRFHKLIFTDFKNMGPDDTIVYSDSDSDDDSDYESDNE